MEVFVTWLSLEKEKGKSSEVGRVRKVDKKAGKAGPRNNGDRREYRECRTFTS